jgi:hypothetical protein
MFRQPESMPITDEHYDLVVIGSGSEGQKAAINAAKLVNKLYDLNESHATAGELTTGFPEVLIRRGLVSVSRCNRQLRSCDSNMKRKFQLSSRWTVPIVWGPRHPCVPFGQSSATAVDEKAVMAGFPSWIHANPAGSAIAQYISWNE